MVYNWGYESPKCGYPNYNLRITLPTKSHEPVSPPLRTWAPVIEVVCKHRDDAEVKDVAATEREWLSF